MQKCINIDRSVFAHSLFLFLVVATVSFFESSNEPIYCLIQSLFVNLCPNYTFKSHHKIDTRCKNLCVVSVQNIFKNDLSVFALGLFSDVTHGIFLLTLTIVSFRTKFSKHVFTTILASYALIMHRALFSMERSM